MNKKSWKVTNDKWEEVDDPFYAHKSMCDENLPDDAPLEARLELLGFTNPSRLFEKDGTIIELFANGLYDFPYPYFLILDVKGKKAPLYISNPPTLLDILSKFPRSLGVRD